MTVVLETILNQTEAYILDLADVTNVLAGGPYHLGTSLAHLTGYDSVNWTFQIVTDAAAIRAHRILYVTGGYAVWQVLDANEDFAGYLTVLDGDGLLVKVTDGVLSEATITTEQYLARLQTYFASVTLTTEFSDVDQIPIAVPAAKGLVVPVPE
jgi:hypothetical protein